MLLIKLRGLANISARKQGGKHPRGCLLLPHLESELALGPGPAANRLVGKTIPFESGSLRYAPVVQW
jgi:hypothetical protein